MWLNFSGKLPPFSLMAEPNIPQAHHILTAQPQYIHKLEQHIVSSRIETDHDFIGLFLKTLFWGTTYSKFFVTWRESNLWENILNLTDQTICSSRLKSALTIREWGPEQELWRISVLFSLNFIIGRDDWAQLITCLKESRGSDAWAEWCERQQNEARVQALRSPLPTRFNHRPPFRFVPRPGFDSLFCVVCGGAPW